MRSWAWRIVVALPWAAVGFAILAFYALHGAELERNPVTDLGASAYMLGGAALLLAVPAGRPLTVAAVVLFFSLLVVSGPMMFMMLSLSGSGETLFALAFVGTCLALLTSALAMAVGRREQNRSASTTREPA